MKKGNLSLEIINAETKQPMKEFTAPDGKVYVEAEPDLEYFLRCANNKNNSHEKRTCVEFFIDNTKLNYLNILNKNKPSTCGIWQRINRVSSTKALKFSLKATNAAAAAANQSGTTNPFHVGTIKAVFSKAIDIGVKETKDHTTKLENGTTTQTGKKAFVSVKGSTTTTKTEVSKFHKCYRCGEKLGEITIHYTSALGFIHLGILPSAPEPVTNNQREHQSTSSVARIEVMDGNNNNNNSDEGPARKRVKTESSRTTTSSSTSRNEVVDLCGDQKVMSNEIINLT